MQLISGKISTALKVVVYGPEGIGKSTFASMFPGPVVYIDTEGSTRHMDVTRTPTPTSWTAILEMVKHFIAHPGEVGTLVIDTADWAERMCTEELCAKNHLDGLEAFGYGKGYVYQQENFGKLLDLLTQLVSKGVNALINAHAQMRKFEEPNETGSYDRWELKLTKKVAPMVKEWADMVLFANYKVNVVNVDGQGATKGKNKAQGGRRVMYATHHPCWDAKNRFGLPDEMPFEFEKIAHLFPGTWNAKLADRSNSAPEQQGGRPMTVPTEDGGRAMRAPTGTEDGDTGNTAEEEPRVNNTAPTIFDVDGGEIPPDLAYLMLSNSVTAQEIRAVVSGRGYFPAKMAIADYPEDFIRGCLLAAWDQVYQQIVNARKNLPF